MSSKTKPLVELGLMGGMFDPVHYGHLNTARAVCRHLQLDDLHFLPCGNPVHRPGLLEDAAQRLAMLALVTDDTAGLHVDDRECRSAAPSYTIDSLRAIRAERSGCRLYYVMGQDAFNGFHTWKAWREIFGLAHLVVAARPGYAPDLAPELAGELRDRKANTREQMKEADCGLIYLAQLEDLDISSTLVRDRLRRGEAVDALLPPAVAAYIKDHGLYLAKEQT